MKKIVLILIILISGCATSNLPKIEPVEKISLDNFNIRTIFFIITFENKI